MFLSATAPRSQTLCEIPDGVAGVGVTLTHMTRFVREYKTHPDIRDKAIWLVRDLEQKDFAGEVEKIFDFVQNNVRYVHDVADVETLQTPIITLQNRAGDCDDKSTLLAAMLESIGHKTRFIAAGFQRNTIEHVFVETRVGSQWVSLDATEQEPMGWRPPAIVASIVRHN